MGKESYFQKVRRMTGTCYWINNPTLSQARQAIKEGAVGCTTNPAYISKIIGNPVERERITAMMDERIRQGMDDLKVLESVQSTLVAELAKEFYAIYEDTGHRQGYVSIQGNPLDESAENILAYAETNAAMSPNITPKIPVTPDGLIALEKLMEKGIPVNSTEIMSVRQFIDVAEIYERITRNKVGPAIAFYSHIAGIFDESIGNYVRDNNVDIEPDYIYQAGLCVARKITQLKHERGYSIRYVNGGARGLHHFTEFVGADCNITINWTGTSEDLLKLNPVVIERYSAQTPHSVVDTLIERIPDFAAAYRCNGISPDEYEEFAPVALFRRSFVKGWISMLELVAQRRSVIES